MFAPMLADSPPMNWTGLVIALVALAAGWVILRVVLRLTLKVFACGCTVLLAVVGAAFAWMYWGQIAVWFK